MTLIKRRATSTRTRLKKLVEELFRHVVGSNPPNIYFVNKQKRFDGSLIFIVPLIDRNRFIFALKII